MNSEVGGGVAEEDIATTTTRSTRASSDTDLASASHSNSNSNSNSNSRSKEEATSLHLHLHLPLPLPYWSCIRMESKTGRRQMGIVGEEGRKMELQKTLSHGGKGSGRRLLGGELFQLGVIAVAAVFDGVLAHSSVDTASAATATFPASSSSHWYSCPSYVLGFHAF